MLSLLRQLPVPVLVVLGAALLVLFLGALADGLASRRVGFLAGACLVLAALALLRRGGGRARDRGRGG